MATGGVLGNGTRVGYSATSPVSWTRVGQVLDVEFPSLVADDVDTTVHSGSNFKKNMPGMYDPPEFTLELLADLNPTTSATHEALRTYQANRTTIWFRIEVPVDRTQTQFRAFTLQAYVKEWTPTTPIDDKQTIRVVARFDGEGIQVDNPASATVI